MKKLFQQLIRFGAVGVFCTLLDYGLMVLMTEAFGVNYLLSSGISFSVSTLVNYVLSILFVFRGGGRSKGQSLVVFVLLSAVGLGINQLLMKVGVDFFQINYMITKIGATAIVMIFNFITRKLLLDQPADSQTQGEREKKEKKTRRRPVLRVILCLLGVVLAVILAYVIYVFASYHRIEDKVLLEVEGETAAMEQAQVGETYSIVTYNVGFGAYTPDYTFFMDGGTSSWAASKESVIDTIQGAANLVNSLDPDIVLLEEVDLDATRSYHVDQSQLFDQALEGYCSVYAIDYDSPFLFYPFTQPHGKSLAAIGVYSRLPITSSLRRSLPVSQGVSKLVDLDRCYSVSRIPVENGKELVIYAIHMSAYGNSAPVREGQKTMLQEDMAAEVAAGNYVICGGDFNHNLLELDENATGESWAYPYPRSYLPEGMHFCLDLLSQEEREAVAPTTRNADIPYDPEESLCLVIDGFIISDNIEQLSYSTVDSGFAYSDHNPVQLTFRLAGE